MCEHDLGGLEISGEEKTIDGADHVASLYVSCPLCSRLVKGKPKKGRKITIDDKDRLKAAQELVAEHGFPKKKK
jgi:hypothetical protein